jgi:hypothetical protein
MSDMKLLLNNTVFPFPSLALCQVCTKFQTKPLTESYSVTSKVSSELFELFLSALKGETIEVTKTNFKELSILSNEFGFELKSPSYRLSQVEVLIEELKIAIGSLSNEVTSLNGKSAITAQHSEAITQLNCEVSVLKRWIRIPETKILSDFPKIFAEFRGKQFSLLWRGGRDGFEAKEFHRRCDGHSNSLTVILDTKGNIFGGFTPLKWESRVWNGKDEKENNTLKADDSQKSFVFTLKNPHNIPAKRFALNAEMKWRAIGCNSKRGPNFYDIVISDNCNTNTKSFAYFNGADDSYINDTGLNGETIFAGLKNFQVKEIEVFEITD